MTPARLFVHRFRRPIAAACAALAVLLTAAALRPASPDLVEVVLAADDLPAGSTLGVDDLALGTLPAAHLAPGALVSVDDATGRTIAAGISAGEVITRSRLVDTGPRADGLHTVPVRLADPQAADLLHPGAVIDLVLASGDATGRVIAEGAQVVTVPRSPATAGLGSSRSAGTLIVVATDRRTAVALAAAGTQPGLGVVLR